VFGVKVRGRLGNQMFIYALALAQAERLRSEFFLYKQWRFLLPRYFRIPPDRTVGSYRETLRFFARHRFAPRRIVQDQAVSPAATLELLHRDEVLVDGFFQSEDYFARAAERVRTELCVKDRWRARLCDYTANARPTILVHVRRTDYLTFGGGDTGFGLALPASYYRAALAALDTRGKNVVFVGDDVLWARENVGVENATYLVDSSEIVDLQLLMQADELVISNSTFAWWGAYLNERAERVMSPLHWLGFKTGREHPAGVTRAGWTPIAVHE